MVKEKDPKSITFMMVSDGNTKTYSLPKRMVQGLVGLAAVVVIAMVAVLVQVGINGQLTSSEQAELDTLRAKNIEQQEQINVLAQKANALQADVNRIHSLEEEMRQLTNTPTSEPVSRSGIERPMTGVMPSSMRAGADINSVAGKMNTLAYSLQASETNLKQMHAILQDRYNSLMTSPSGTPAHGEFSSYYGSRWGRLHAGIDIANDVGTPINATAAGVVVSSGWEGAYGYCVTIDHGNGMTTLYGHCSELLVSEGTRVKKGQVIALMGNTGRSTGPHVHYEVHIDGVAVNPASYL